MGKLFAISGKGGVGKTTVSALIVRQLIRGGYRPVLAVDADPNACLDAALGVAVTGTVGRAREEVREEAAARAGISKQELLQMKIAEALVEADDFDLIAMGRPEGAGCYCYANNVLKSVIAEIAWEYPFVVLDNEAGLENLSRRIVSEVDILLLVSDPSAAGLATLTRLYALAREMGVKYKRLTLVINRLRSGMPAAVSGIMKETGADDVLGLPDDAAVAAFAEEGRSIWELPDDNPVALAIDEWIKDIITTEVKYR
jgi:CO dehydrogenase maturation factor